MDWVKPHRSTNNGQCVEVAIEADGSVAVRDDKLGDASPILQFTRREWLAFIDSVKDGQFDPRLDHDSRWQHADGVTVG